MKKIIIVIFFCVLFYAAGQVCQAGREYCPKTTCQKASPKTVCPKAGRDRPQDKQAAEENPLDKILTKLHGRTAELTSYQAGIKYLLIRDPVMLDSRTLRKGRLYYLKDKERSNLRINFEMFKQDDEEEQKQRKEFIFDGVWLVNIDYQFERIDYTQLAPKKKPEDVFELLGRNFPIIGFSKTWKLPEQFEITLIEAQPRDPNNLIHLHLEAKKGIKYKNDYKMVDFWIDNATFLPARIVAEANEGDIYDIQFLESKVNKKLKKCIFKVETPEHFSKNVKPLSKR